MWRGTALRMRTAHQAIPLRTRSSSRWAFGAVTRVGHLHMAHSVWLQLTITHFTCSTLLQALPRHAQQVRPAFILA